MSGQRPQARVRGGKEPILRAAIDNFQRFGYHGTAMRDIARDAQVTVASIYHHYPSKQEILQQIMVAVLSDSISLTRAAVKRAGESATDQLVAIMRAWVLFHTRRRSEAMIGASEIRSLEAGSRRLVVTLRDEQERIFREVIERGVESGEFETAYPHEATWAVITMGNTVATFFRPSGPLKPEQLADIYADLALGTVRTRRVHDAISRTASSR